MAAGCLPQQQRRENFFSRDAAAKKLPELPELPVMWVQRMRLLQSQRGYPVGFEERSARMPGNSGNSGNFSAAQPRS